MSRITIKDVARAAQVSTTTVSHVINGTRYVDPLTKERVDIALKQLEYHPNSLARSLRSGVSKVIGLIVPDISNQFFSEIARKIEDFGFQKGYSVVLCNSDDDPAKQVSYIHTLQAKQVDGIIFISSGSEPDDLARLVENHVPLVVADREVPLELADVVLLNNEKAGYDATSHLIELGHTSIACVTGPNHLTPSMQRMEGYKRCLKEHSILFRPELVEKGDFHFESGRDAVQRLLHSPRPPSAVFALNDMMAIGAIAAANDLGIRVPQDLSIIGFDNIALGTVVTPALTTMAQPIPEMAFQAISLLLDRLNGNRQDMNQRIILEASLVVRGSTARNTL